jgi:hypothetical protein
LRTTWLENFLAGLVSFASVGWSVSRMKKPRTDAVEVMLAGQTRATERSPLFLWLLEHHDEIVASLQGGRVNWRAFCAAVAEAGLTDTAGHPPTENTARVTWYRVRRLAAKQRAGRERARAVRMGGVMSSPMPPSVQQSTATAPGPGTPTTQGSCAPQGAPSEATLAELNRIRERLRTRGY